jgi:hypothetical protein
MFVSKLPPKPDFDVLAAAAPASMAELNAALLAAIEPASAPPARSRSNGRGAPDQRASREHAISL